MSHQLAGIGKSYRVKLSKVLERNPRIIKPDLVMDTLAVSVQEAGRLLSRWSKSGWIKRIRRGLYIPIPLESSTGIIGIDEPSLIADSIYGPGYLAGFSAVKHWDLSEQIMETITYFTLKKIKNREPIIDGIRFRLKTITERKIFGLKPIWIGSKKISVSDPSKTLIDLLDDPKLAGGIQVVSDILQEYVDSEHYNFEQLVDYGHRMQNKAIFKRLGFLMEIIIKAEDKVLSELRKSISSGYAELDPTVQATRYISKWRLKTTEYWNNRYDREK